LSIISIKTIPLNPLYSIYQNVTLWEIDPQTGISEQIGNSFPSKKTFYNMATKDYDSTTIYTIVMVDDGSSTYYVLARNVIDGTVINSWKLPFLETKVDRPLINYDTYSDMLYLLGRDPAFGINNFHLIALDPHSNEISSVAILSGIDTLTGVSAYDPTSDIVFFIGFQTRIKVLFAVSVDSGTIVRRIPTDFLTLDFDILTGFLYAFSTETVTYLLNSTSPHKQKLTSTTNPEQLQSTNVLVLEKMDPESPNSISIVSVYDKYNDILGFMSSIDINGRKLTAILSHQADDNAQQNLDRKFDLVTTNIDNGEVDNVVYAMCRTNSCPETSLIYISMSKINQSLP